MRHSRLRRGRNCLARARIATLLLALCAATVTTAGALPTILQQQEDLIVDNFPGVVGIDGPGYFVVRDPVYNVFSATRTDFLTLNTDGFLVTALGQCVQGYVDTNLTVIGDLQVEGPVWSSINDLTGMLQLQSNGLIVANPQDGPSIVMGQILLQNFQNPSALVPQGWLDFGWSDAAGPLPQLVPPGTSGTARLLPGMIEPLTPQLQISRYTGPPTSFSQGVLIATGVPTDFGIEGNGFFVLRRTNDNALFATRAGGFYIDGSGCFVHYSGLRLQGFLDSTQTTIGDVGMDLLGTAPEGDPNAYVIGFSTDKHGVITEDFSDGSSCVRGQILLAGCANPNAIARGNFDLYPLATNNGLWSSLAPPITGDLGWLVGEALEVSQFDTNLLAVRNRLNFFRQGSILIGTEVMSDLGIMGPGFFTVRDPVANTLYATRNGAFQWDAAGHLVTSNGWRVQGFTNAAGPQIGDIAIAGPETNSYVELSGNVMVNLPDGLQYLYGQVLIEEYRDLQALVPAGNGFYTNVTAAVPIVTNRLAGRLPYSIYAGYLEEPPASPSPLVLPPPPGGYRLFVSNLGSGVVESSTDLLHWNSLALVNGSPDLNVAEFFDTPETAQTFYRIVTPTLYPLAP